jgi:hypothetical protein
MSDEYYFSEIQCKKGHISYRRIPDNACVICIDIAEKTKERERFKKLPGDLVLFKHYAHTDDVEAIEAFIKSLFVKRGMIK